MLRAAFAMSLAATACAPATAQELRQELAGHMRREVSSGRAALAGHLDGEQRLRLALVLPLRDPAGLAAFLTGLYDPSSPDYRRYLTQDEFRARFAPSQADYDAVAAFARGAGFEVGPAAANRLVVPVTATTAQIESAFHVRMNLYQHPIENRVFFSPDREPSVDASLRIAHIAGLNNFSTPSAALRRPIPLAALPAGASGSGPGGSYLASDMRAAYYGSGTLTGAGETVALVEFDGYNQSDVDLVFASAGQSYSVPIRNVLLDGADGEPASGDDGEQVLDIVQAIGMAPGLAQVRVYIGSIDADILNAIASENDAREVSISWTWSPEDPATDDEFFAEMAAQGQTVIAASGDSGEFDPLIDNFYPPEDALVTATGGTHLETAGAGGAWASEIAWTLSGGGISPDGIPIPPWQAGVANSANGGSTSLRNVPDVAMEADADNFSCDMGACSETWGGTSFAAPRWAGFIALANQQALAAGAPPVGFVNPAIYSLGAGSGYNAAFHDITQGNNNATNGCCGLAWFNAVSGYDLVTGWGTPAGQALIDALAPPAAPPFAVNASAPALAVAPGASGATQIVIARNAGFSGAVALAVAGLPSGVTASWGANPAGASSTLTLWVGAQAQRGSWLLTVTGTSGAASASTQVALEVNAPGFTLVPAKNVMLLFPGTSEGDTIAVTDLAGFEGSVNLAVTGLPPGVTASWVGNPTTGTAELALTADPGTDPVRIMITITGTSGALTATTTIALAIEAPEFYLDISPYPLQLAQGDSVASTVTVVPVGSFSSPVEITAAQLPSGVTASFSPASTPQASSLTFTAAAAATPGSWPIDIHGSAPGTATDVQFSQTIAPAGTPGFLLGVAPAYASVARGASAIATVCVLALDGFNAPVTLSVLNLPSGVTASWSANPATQSSTLTLTASSVATLGPPAAVTVQGAAGNSAALATFYLAVNPVALPAHAPAISATDPLFANAGSAAATLTVNGSGFTPSSSLYWAGTAIPTTYISPSRLSAAIPASGFASPGVVAITINNPASGGGVSSTFQFEVDSPSTAGGATPGFSPSAATAAAGSATNFTVTLAAQATSVTCLNLPAGASCAWSATTGVLTIATAQATPAGVYPITVVVTESVPASSAIRLVIPLVLLPWILFRRKLRRRLMRVADYASLLLVAAALVSACASIGGSSTSPQPEQVTRSGVVNLTVQ
jgi:hypothetical protein